MSNLKRGGGRPRTEEEIERIAEYIDNPDSAPLPPYLQHKLDLLTVVNGYVNKHGYGARVVKIIKKEVPTLADVQDRVVLRHIRECMLVFTNPTALAGHARQKLLDDLFFAMELAKKEKDVEGINKTALTIIRLTGADKIDKQQTALLPPVIMLAPLASANAEDFMPTDLDALTTEFEVVKTEISKSDEQ
jgi:hypothetical protein